MAVGSLLNIEIVPGRGADVIEGVQAVEQIRSVLRRAVQDTVENGDRLSAGDVFIRRVGRTIAVDPAEFIEAQDIFFGTRKVKAQDDLNETLLMEIAKKTDGEYSD